MRVTSGPLFHSSRKVRISLPTIATTGATEVTIIAPYTGRLAGAIFVSASALAANDTNYLTWTIQNKGNSNAVMLAAADSNTSKSTGGAALVAFTKRTLALNATPANLAVTAGDVISVAATATGTLAGAVAGGSVELTFTPI